MELRRVGRYALTDDEGKLLNSSRPEENAAHWLDTFERVKACYLQAWPELIHSIYVRGSVAKGTAIDQVSDLDTLAVVHAAKQSEFEALEPAVLESWQISREKALMADLPFITGLELDLVPFAQVFDRKHVYGFTIKVESVCIHGENLAEALAPYTVNAELAYQTRYFHKHLALFQAEYPDEPESEKPGFVAWLMRRFLRLGMEFVMEREKRYTRDLYLCYESFAAHYPMQAQRMYHALGLAIHPNTDAQTLDFIEDFGNWLVTEAARQLERWHYSQSEDGQWVDLS